MNFVEMLCNRARQFSTRKNKMEYKHYKKGPIDGPAPDAVQTLEMYATKNRYGTHYISLVAVKDYWVIIEGYSLYLDKFEAEPRITPSKESLGFDDLEKARKKYSDLLEYYDSHADEVEKQMGVIDPKMIEPIAELKDVKDEPKYIFVKRTFEHPEIPGSKVDVMRRIKISKESDETDLWYYHDDDEKVAMRYSDIVKKFDLYAKVGQFSSSVSNIDKTAYQMYAKMTEQEDILLSMFHKDIANSVGKNMRFVCFEVYCKLSPLNPDCLVPKFIYTSMMLVNNDGILALYMDEDTDGIVSLGEGLIGAHFLESVKEKIMVEYKFLDI